MMIQGQKDALDAINNVQAKIERAFAAHAVMYEGVKKIAQGILIPLKDRPDNELTAHEKQLVDIARDLVDLLSTSAAALEGASKHE